MSKTDAMRAMKQARAEAAAASRPAAPRVTAKASRATAPASRATGPAPVRVAPPTAAEQAALPVDLPGGAFEGLAPEALCGHQAIGGKRCTRPQGHAEKNHRYAA